MKFPHITGKTLNLKMLGLKLLVGKITETGKKTSPKDKTLRPLPLGVPPEPLPQNTLTQTAEQWLEHWWTEIWFVRGFEYTR